MRRAVGSCQFGSCSVVSVVRERVLSLIVTTVFKEVVCIETEHVEAFTFSRGGKHSLKPVAVAHRSSLGAKHSHVRAT